MQTYSPIVSSEDYHCGFFISIPEPKQLQEACVLTGGKKPSLIITQNNNAEVKAIQRGKYTKLVRVDKSERQIETEFYATDEVGVYAFHVQLAARCEVLHPVTVCEKNVTDAAQCLNSMLKAEVASVARNFSMERWKEFEAALKTRFEKAEQSEESWGLHFSRLFVSVSADQEWLEIQREKARIRGRGELKATEIEESNKLSSLPLTAVTGIFSSVLSGTLTLEEAHDQMEQRNSARFDEVIRRIEKLRAGYKAMVDEGLMPESKMAFLMGEEIDAVSAEFSASRLGTGGAAALLEGSVPNPYAPRDEDELD